MEDHNHRYFGNTMGRREILYVEFIHDESWFNKCLEFKWIEKDIGINNFTWCKKPPSHI
jgi:hypothetical protein